MPPDSQHLEDEQPPAPAKKQTPVAKLAAPVTPTTECEQHANGARCTEPKKGLIRGSSGSRPWLIRGIPWLFRGIPWVFRGIP